MKSILISIRPRHVANILNGLKTKEIRKYFPKDYRGWVNIYCTKDNNEGLYFIDNKFIFRKYPYGYVDCIKCIYRSPLNGKVVARFYCDNVEEIKPLKHKPSVFCPYNWLYYIVNDSPDNLKKNSCLDFNELHTYLQGKNGKAINITKLEIFDEPKELSEFKHLVKGNKLDHSIDAINYVGGLPLTKAPQSWCYVEELL